MHVKTVQNEFVDSADIPLICVVCEQIRLYVETWKDMKFKVQSVLLVTSEIRIIWDADSCLDFYFDYTREDTSTFCIILMMPIE